MAACSWYSPTAPCRHRAVEQGRSLGDQRRGPTARGPARPAGSSSPAASVRAGRRASVSSMSASRPATSPSSGSSRVHDPRQPDRLVRELGAVHVAAAAARVALVEDQVEHVQHRRAAWPAARPASASGTARRSLDLLLRAADPLRHRRLAAPGTRSAISAVVRPPTARSVSAIAEAGVSAGWQHMNSRISVSSRSEIVRRRRLQRARRSSRRRRAGSLRHWSISRRVGGLHQPAAAGSPGPRRAASAARRRAAPPARRPRRRRSRRSRRTSAPRTCGADSRSRSSTPGDAFSSRRPRAPGTPPSRRRSTEPGSSSAAPGSAAGARSPSGPGTAEIFAGDLDRTLLGLDVDDLVAGHPLLELLERAVGDDRARCRPSKVTIFARSGPVEHL